MDELQLKSAEVMALIKENDLLRARNDALQATLNKNREPDGEREEKVAEWLRGRGYTVTAPEPS